MKKARTKKDQEAAFAQWASEMEDDPAFVPGEAAALILAVHFRREVLIVDATHWFPAAYGREGIPIYMMLVQDHPSTSMETSASLRALLSVASRIGVAARLHLYPQPLYPSNKRH